MTVEQGDFLAGTELRKRLRRPRDDKEHRFARWCIAEARARGWKVGFLPDWLYRLGFASMQRQLRSDREWPDRGFPDLILLRPGKLMFRELKVAGGMIAREQRDVIKLLRSAGADVAVWWDVKQDDIVRELEWQSEN